ncbi:MAG TPA: hypothetical protein VHG28_13620 [Longimicrobiaceae bacterium]|nr:hypothetical protein [Longimicrobiaceae bacterium]
MSGTMRGGVLGEVPRALGALLAAEVQLGRELLEAVGLPVPDLRRVVRRKAGRCDIPPPCWMPRSLGECVGTAAPCQRACVRLRVTNCDRARRQVHVGVVAGWKVEVSPASVVLGPFERATVEVCVHVPDSAVAGETHEMLVRVRGCREHYLRWTLRVGSCCDATSCHEVAVDDCPDYWHHWYDHFYCERGCLPRRDIGHAVPLEAHA